LIIAPALEAQVPSKKAPNKIVFSFQKQKDPQSLQRAATELASVLADKIGKPVDVVVPTTYSTAVQGLISGKVHVAYMDSLPYLLATPEVGLDVVAVEKRNGRTDYDSLIVVATNSPAKKLSDLRGRRMAFTSQTSTSGYLVPFSRLVEAKALGSSTELSGFFSEVIFAGGYDKALRAVISGQADAAAFSDYVLEGPKADLYGTAEDRARVRVLDRAPGVPTHLVAVRRDLPPELKKKIGAALLGLSSTHAELLASVYGASELVAPPPDDRHVDRTRRALKETRLEAKAFIK
jgi:phosphonate transport system substrate-binding protein